MENSIFSKFTGLYSLQKTLQFELRPQGKTLEYIEERGLLKEDKQRAREYKVMKAVIDRFHKHFIQLALKGFELGGLEEYSDLFFQTPSSPEEKLKRKETLGKMEASMMKEVALRFSKHPEDGIKEIWGKWDKAKLVSEILPEFVENEEERAIVSNFNRFTTYFQGFHENRKNIYSADGKKTSIGYRLVKENLPRFLANVKAYREYEEMHPNLDLSPLDKEMEVQLGGMRHDRYFEPEGFNLTLTQKGIETYNLILGGKSSEHGKEKGINEYVNLYNQQVAGKEGRKAPLMKLLYKQILSDRESFSYVPEGFEGTGSEVVESLRKYYLEGLRDAEVDGHAMDILEETEELMDSLKGAALDEIFLRNDRSLTDVSQSVFGDWAVLGNAIEHHYLTAVNPPKNMEKLNAKQEEAMLRWKRNEGQFSLQMLASAIEQWDKAGHFPLPLEKLAGYFGGLEGDKESPKLTGRIEKSYMEMMGVLEGLDFDEKGLIQRKKVVPYIKGFLDSVIDLHRFLKRLIPKDPEIDKDDAFYGRLERLDTRLDEGGLLYNRVRNYLTRKPYSIEKIKLNFQKNTLLGGWDTNKEKDNLGVLLRKDGLFYLALITRGNTKVFKNYPGPAQHNASYEKMVYKFLPGPNKMLPKAFFSKKGLKKFPPPPGLLDRYDSGTHTKGDNFSIKDCHALIDWFKLNIPKYPGWDGFGMQFSPTESYQDISQFYREVAEQGYKVEFENLPADYIEQLVEDGKIYLFQIYNKDFSPDSTGRPNLHTLYWKLAFDQRNLTDVVYKLNGGAEVFYRERSITYSPEEWAKGHHADVSAKKGGKPFISNRRYALDKFQFHCPIEINFKAQGTDRQGGFNAEVNKALGQNPKVHVIGIDRGERHLLYYSLIDPDGKIIEQGTLNKVGKKFNPATGENEPVDYREKLEGREKERAAARESWDTVEAIKELKQGYLSQVVHEVVQKMVQYNAVVVMENLNAGFKRGRFKVEKQVYQKFEKMLVEKLNYLAFKAWPDDQPGGMMRGYQLTPKIDKVSSLDGASQWGFIFYVPAAYTSKIDPRTGFVDFLRPKYESMEKARNFLRKFRFIRFNPERDWFEFRFDYGDFTEKAAGARQDWTVCTTHEPRYWWNPRLANGKGEMELVEAVTRMKTLLMDAGVNYHEGNDLREAICQVERAEFYRELLWLLRLTLSLRQTNGKGGEQEEDHIVSPVMDSQGGFFHSGRANEGEPDNADANGAYHIALKGLAFLQKIREAKEGRKPDLKLENRQWLAFVQDTRQ